MYFDSDACSASFTFQRCCIYYSYVHCLCGARTWTAEKGSQKVKIRGSLAPLFQPCARVKSTQWPPFRRPRLCVYTTLPTSFSYNLFFFFKENDLFKYTPNHQSQMACIGHRGREWREVISYTFIITSSNRERCALTCCSACCVDRYRTILQKCHARFWIFFVFLHT